MLNDYMVLRMGQERASELYREAEEAGLTQRRWREKKLASPARVGRLASGLIAAATVIAVVVSVSL